MTRLNSSAEMPEHQTELRERVEFRYNTSYCIEPTCEYFNQPAVQGHCHTRLDDETIKDILRIEKRAEDTLQFYKERYQGEEYVKVLESLFLCGMMNWDSILDQLVYLRKENAELKLKSRSFWY